MKNSPFVMVAMMAGAAHAAGPAEIELVRGGKAYELSEAARARIGEELPKLFATCSLNSRDHPQIFASRPAAVLWQEAQAKDRLSVRLGVRHLLLGLDDARFPGPELSRNGEDVVAYSKCSGGDMIKFVCAAELKPMMPGSYHQLCRVLK